MDFAKLSTAAIIGGLTAILLMALAAILFVNGSDAEQRLGLFFAMSGTAVAALISLLRADQTKTQTNGGLDARISQAVQDALAARRASDPTDKGA